jgi:hypothetical protein
MAGPTWTTNSSLGIVKHLSPCNKTLTATGATSYSLISGILPLGLSLAPDGLISGTPKLDNIIANTQGTSFTFTVRAINNAGFVNRTFTLDVVANDLYVPENFTMPRCRIGSNFLQYQIPRGDTNTSSNLIWRVSEGNLPPGTTLNPNGSLEILPGQNIYPFKREQFIKSTVNTESISSLSQESWDSWMKEFVSTVKERDYQFRLTLSDGINPAFLSITCRVMIIPFPVSSSWFQTNSSYLNLPIGQEYIFFAISDFDYIYWNTDSNLGSVYNGSLSELSINATCNTSKGLLYSIKPSVTSKLPQQLTLLDNGLITGRVSFRCYQDDPVSVPINDNYTFTVRASTADRFTYTEKTFNLNVIRYHDKPYNNIWSRSFPTPGQRTRFSELIKDQTFFPDKFLYRAADKYFGKARHLRFLLAAGVPPATVEEYYSLIFNNHYNKVVLFGDVKTAISYDDNFNIKYEVVYVPLIDYSQITNLKTNSVISQPNTIDLRSYVKNFYYQDEQIYYEFEPNGIENMRRAIGYSGYSDTGILPSWMTSIQPIPNLVGQFNSPPGFVACVVLAYTTPGSSAAIAYRLKQAGMNFNEFKFEFDRYELDDNMSRSYDLVTDSFITPGTETIFDSGTTVFENGATRFNQNLDYSTEISDRDPDFGTKYLKFPKTGVFV